MAKRSALSSFVLRGWFGLSRSQGITGLGISSFVIYPVYQHIRCVNTYYPHMRCFVMERSDIGERSEPHPCVGMRCLGYSIRRRIFRFA